MFLGTEMYEFILLKFIFIFSYDSFMLFDIFYEEEFNVRMYMPFLEDRDKRGCFWKSIIGLEGFRGSI